ncbi:universal stress protein [Alkalilimnicola sp. S0819]|uniref:universal stress protein n=1 Tax=Alkalilimnicola sp. S0819 TaxID=2613922 RepID=UPI001261FE6C|nr:universal stress protein [Alkalilimnicola sp. S0819]KAB7627318.1 universal stress protein [Alkalilimnicola sp. S0819]MPQ16033.1 universal stress protein [Alkalilimnicola sp. S0819]
MLRRILVPVDFSRASACALAVARDYCPEGATVRLLHVLNPSELASRTAEPKINPMHAKEIRGEAEQQARDRLEAWALDGEEIALEIGKAAEKISEHADAWEADMIAMGTGSRTGLAHFLHGSATEWLVRHARQPVLAVHEVDLHEDQRRHLPPLD